MELTPRLRKVYDLLGEGGTVIDVGSDHGYLPAKLLADGRYRFAIISDVAEGPLRRAIRTLEGMRLDDRCDFVLGDGLKGINPLSEDYSVAVCGMGGELIASILDSSHGHRATARLFVLQPMTKQEKLRRYLWDNGYEITRECAAAEGEKVYTVMSVRYTGEPVEYIVPELFLGKRDAREVSEASLLSLRRSAEKAEKIARSKCESGRDGILYEFLARAAAIEIEQIKECMK